MKGRPGFVLFWLIVIPLSCLAAQEMAAEQEMLLKKGPAIELSVQAQSKLLRDGIVILDKAYPSFLSLYEANYHAGIPQFITTDCALYLSHVAVSASIRALELGYMSPTLHGFLRRLWALGKQAHEQVIPDGQKAAWKAILARIYVALKLLGDDLPLPAILEDQADRIGDELRLIRDAQGPDTSPLLGYPVDYVQFKPRGHYTISEEFTRYFQAVKWLSLPFRLLDHDEALQAILLTRALIADEELRAQWSSLDALVSFIAGPPDDLDFSSLGPLVLKAFGEDTPPEALSEELEAFIAQVRAELPTPKILPYWAAAQGIERSKAQGFALFPARLVPDSWIFQELVYSKVGTPEKPRLFPKGLDLFAALGNRTAQEILRREGDFDYVGYSKQLDKLRVELEEMKAQWQGTLYWQWLSALLALRSPEQVLGLPGHSLWELKQLNTSLAGWTLLRHDTALYVKQSVTMAMGISAFTQGAVEPYPLFYRKMKGLVEALVDQVGSIPEGLAEVKITPEALNLPQLVNWLSFLEGVAEKEILGEPLSEKEYMEIWDIAGTIRDLTTFPDQLSEKLGLGQSLLPVVVDVHTDPNTGHHLLEGVGWVRPMVILCSIGGEPRLMRGGVLSYYEWQHPTPLTDAEWEKLLEEGGVKCPTWLGELLAPAAG